VALVEGGPVFDCGPATNPDTAQSELRLNRYSTCDDTPATKNVCTPDAKEIDEDEPASAENGLIL
jgi:hypothetical protein